MGLVPVDPSDPDGPTLVVLADRDRRIRFLTRAEAERWAADAQQSGRYA